MCTLVTLMVALLASGVQEQSIEVLRLNRTSPVVYEKEIEPILEKKCMVCHRDAVTRGKFDLGSHANLLKGGKSGSAVVAGQSGRSLLIQLAGKSRKPFMPPKDEDPLSPNELALIKLWIDQGAKGPLTMAKREESPVKLRAVPASVHPVRALAFSPDGKWIVAARGTEMHAYETSAGKHLRAMVDPALRTSAHATPIEACAVDQKGSSLASSAFREVSIWDPHTGKLVKKLDGFKERIMGLAFSPDGTRLAAVGGPPTEEGEIKLFDVVTGKLLLDIRPGHSDTVFGVCFSPDGTKIGTCSADKFVRVFEVASGKLLKTFEGHTNYVLDLGWRADGKVLVSAGADNVLKVWDYEKGEQIRTMGPLSKQFTRLVFRGKTSEIVACGGDNNARLWNVDNGAASTTYGGSKDFLYVTGISGDGKTVAIGGEEGIVRIYNASNGQLTRELLPPGQPIAPVK